MQRFLYLLRNKYFIASVLFLTWMLFFDTNDLISQYEYVQELRERKEEKEFYIQETEKTLRDINELSTNKEKLEKFAREKYLMKKDNEDVFVIVEAEAEK